VNHALVFANQVFKSLLAANLALRYPTPVIRGDHLQLSLTLLTIEPDKSFENLLKRIVENRVLLRNSFVGG
jgi:hypothetical protein